MGLRVLGGRARGHHRQVHRDFGQEEKTGLYCGRDCGRPASAIIVLTVIISIDVTITMDTHTHTHTHTHTQTDRHTRIAHMVDICMHAVCTVR